MLILIITDIFGLTQDVKSFAKELVKQSGDSFKIIDPYNTIEKSFSDDDEAYQAFTKACGHKNYSQKVRQAIKQLSDETIVIGFSAGASAMWHSTDNNYVTSATSHQYVKHFIGK